MNPRPPRQNGRRAGLDQ